MNVLLDTCALLALTNGPLPSAASGALGAARDAYVSPVSAWEAAIKCRQGKLQLLKSPQEWFQDLCRHYHLTELPLSTALLCSAADLPLYHRDPFDRVLVACARFQNLLVLTSDQSIPKYPGIHTLW